MLKCVNEHTKLPFLKLKYDLKNNIFFFVIKDEDNLKSCNLKTFLRIIQIYMMNDGRNFNIFQADVTATLISSTRQRWN